MWSQDEKDEKKSLFAKIFSTLADIAKDQLEVILTFKQIMTYYCIEAQNQDNMKIWYRVNKK